MSKADAVEEVTEEADAIVLEESQRVLDHQIDSIDAVETKAVWLLRIGVILLGALVSAIRLFGFSEVNPLVFVGIVFIAFSMVVGIIAYGVSDFDVGAGPGSLLGRVPDDYEPSDVFGALLEIHEDSIAFNRTTLQTNEWYLTFTQGLLVVGLSFVVAGFFASI